MTYKEQYANKLLDPKWQRKRLKILDRDNFTCTLCGDTKTTLHVHHSEYDGEPWEVDDSMLETVCEHCHAIIEEFKEVKNKPNEKIKRVIKLISKNDHDFIILVAVFYYLDRDVDLYYFFDYYLDSKKIEYQYLFSSNFLEEFNSKINGKQVP